MFEPEDIFDRFVRNANASTEEAIPRDDEPTGRVPHGEVERREASEPAEGRGGPPSWDHQITVRAAPPRWDDGDDEGTRPDAPMPLAMARAFDDEAEAPDVEVDEDQLTVPRAAPLTDSGQRILLLTRRKSTPPPASTGELAPSDDPSRADADDDETTTWDSVVSPRGLHTQRLEAMRVVPDVEATASRREDERVGEGVEDGQMPTRQLDQILSDMAVLLRYGHAGQVRDRLEQLRRAYPEDLLLLRRIAEFHVEHDQRDAALETLFALAGGLFERRNVEGMRQALEQVLVLDPNNARAFRLLGLLEQRPQGAAD
ncbi:MAG TPA: hypothetical protein RMH99_02720 [Sandaracinaceae bacterium LLY-WYZ-13_1]|nr:hypothetical protein [Sandaracinaceae bacterium LLY-WYZ-13_1]